MRFWLIGGTLAMGALGLVGGAGAQKKPAPGWHTDYEKARAVARQSGKPLFVVFRCQP